MRIFIFLIFFCLQKNTFLTEFNGVFNFSCFAFFSKIILMRFSNFLWSFLLQKNRFLMLKMKIPKVPKIPTKILTAMGSYRNLNAFRISIDFVFLLSQVLLPLSGAFFFLPEGEVFGSSVRDGFPMGVRDTQGSV